MTDFPLKKKKKVLYPKHISANYRTASFVCDLSGLLKYLLAQNWSFCVLFVSLNFKLLITNIYVLSALSVSILWAYSLFSALNALEEPG